MLQEMRATTMALRGFLRSCEGSQWVLASRESEDSVGGVAMCVARSERVERPAVEETMRGGRGIRVGQQRLVVIDFRVGAPVDAAASERVTCIRWRTYMCSAPTSAEQCSWATLLSRRGRQVEPDAVSIACLRHRWTVGPRWIEHRCCCLVRSGRREASGGARSPYQIGDGGGLSDHAPVVVE